MLGLIKFIHILNFSLIWLMFFKGLLAFPMSCKNTNSRNDPVKGDAFDFHCTSTRKFHTCILERTGLDLRSTHCNYTFYSHSFFGSGNRQKELQRVGWDCELDKKEPYRIQVIEKHNEMECHLRIRFLEIKGKKIFR